jgi:hypothetical protein
VVAVLVGGLVGSLGAGLVGSLVGMLVGDEVGLSDVRAGSVDLGVALGRTAGAVGLLKPVVWSIGWVAAAAGRTSR